MRGYFKETATRIILRGRDAVDSALDVFRNEDGLVKRRVGSHMMYLDRRDSGISRSLMRLGRYGREREPAFMHILRQEVKEGMKVADLGANIGYITLILAELVGKKGRVYAVEPVPRNFKILTKNIAANGYQDRIEAHQFAASNKKDEVIFYLSQKSNLGSLIPTGHCRDTIRVPTRTMDEFFKGKQPPHFIKMDIEGHEVEVLDGMMQTLKRAASPLKILLEVHPMYYSEKNSLEKALRKIMEIGFRTKYVVSAGIAEPDFFLERGYAPEKVFDCGKNKRGLYLNIADEHMIIAACRKHKVFIPYLRRYSDKIVRAVMIEK